MTRADPIAGRYPALRAWGQGVLGAVLASVLAACGIVSGPTRGVAALIGGDGDMIQIPFTDDSGDDHLLSTRVCRPPGGAPAPVAILAHGLPPMGETRVDMSPAECSNAAVQWFRARGYAVFLPMRRGYGESGTDWAENPGACANPDYTHAGLEGARDLAAAMAFAIRQPFARPDGAIIVGEDAGGWALLGYASLPHPAAAALVQFGGVQGARSASQLGHICRPDLLIEAAAGFGATARTPMLWVYATGDKVVPAAVVAALHDAFVGAGGHAELVQPSAPGTDGHDLLFDDGGPDIWGGLVDFFLKSG